MNLKKQDRKSWYAFFSLQPSGMSEDAVCYVFNCEEVKEMAYMRGVHVIVFVSMIITLWAFFCNESVRGQTDGNADAVSLCWNTQNKEA